ncbi:SPI-7-type island replicative DNA helicase [Providencia rettgeri]|uniref:SPI-7-type island replicative DNA helicase n=1 Tax=Providencia rettgeri TaxID=587 RepID=UPI00204F754E|nr:SPI-7-type island replicative DNA helicase [Providencia rettgeri]UPQ40154.1 SPI-7-type island replicative DNA helicase [Providencia rettgeri]
MNNVTSDSLYSPGAEQGVLGGLMLDNERWDEIVLLLQTDDFHLGAHRQIWKKMAALCQVDCPIDLITLSEALENDGVLEQVGGFAYLAELSKNTPSAANIVHYAEIVVERSRARGLMALGNMLSSQSIAPRADVLQLCEQAEQRLFQLAERGQSAQQASLLDTFNRVVQRLEGALSAQGITGTPTGFAELDKKTCGLQSGDLVILGARPSMGKTALALAFAQGALIQPDSPIFFFSLEMPAEQIMQRLISDLSNVPLTAIRSASLNDSDWPCIAGAMDKITAWEQRLVIDDLSNVTPALLRVRARRYRRKYGRPGLIIIDYLQLMRSPGQENRTQEISEISRSMKALAKELDCPVLALSQLNRQLEQRANKRPTNGDLRDSGSLEQDADLILFLYRDEVYNENTPDKGVAEIIIGKHRQGPLGTVNVQFNGTYTRFSDFPHGYHF